MSFFGTVPPTGVRPRSARRDMRISTVEGAMYCVMVGVGQEYFVAFALALGLAEGPAGLVATIPGFVGGLVQLAAPFLIKRIGSLRRTMVIFSAIQACSFLPLVVGALLGTMPAWMLYLSVCVYAIINLSQGPAWNTWITTLMPKEIRPRYFSARSRWVQGGIVLGLVTGGLLLGFDKNSASANAVVAFAPLFAIAFLLRLSSSRLLAMHAEPVRMPERFRHVGPRELLARFRTGRDVSVLAFIVTTNFAWQMALPFFTPYVLKHHDLSYMHLMSLTGAVILGKMALAPTIGRLAHKFGPRRILWIGALGMLPLAPLWATADNYWMLLAVQLCFGPVMSCFEIGTLLVQYDVIDEHERASVFATLTMFNGLAMFLGSALGGLLLGPAVATFLTDHGWTISGYTLAFALAAACRLLALPLLARSVPTPHTRDEPRLPPATVRIEPGTGTTIVPGAAEENDPEDNPKHNPGNNPGPERP